MGALAIAALCTGANVATGQSSTEIYGQIPARNLFGLHDPVIPQVDPPPRVLPKVALTGIWTMGGKLAVVKVQNSPKAGEQPGELSLILGEGQRESGIEILQINEKAGTIRVNNSGTEMTIGFDKDAGKVASTPPPGPGPTTAPPNIAAKIRSLNPGTSGYQRMIPIRNRNGQPTPQPPVQQPNQLLIQPQQNAPAEKPLTSDEQAILKELEQAAQPK